MAKQNTKKIFKIICLTVFFFFIFVYAFFRSKDLLVGVKIKNVNIIDGAQVSEKVLEMTGNAKNAKILILDGREIAIDQSGNFKENIALLLGYNIINLKAEDKFGHKDEKNYKLTYEIK